MNLNSNKARALLSMCNLHGSGLEIGGSISPILPKSKGFNVETLDVLDRNSQIAAYERWGIRSSEKTIQEIDFVLKQDGSYVDAVGKTSCYDFIVACCVIEHTVCLVSFLRDCMALLRPNGILALAIPDKRFTFDNFRPLSSIAEAVDRYNSKDKYRHSVGSFCEYLLNYTAISNHEYALAFEPSTVKEKLDSYTISSEYSDLHNWVFTKTSFELIILDLLNLGFLENLRVTETFSHGIEFYVSIQKTGESIPDFDRNKRLALLKQIEIELREPGSDFSNADFMSFCQRFGSSDLYIYGTGYSGRRVALMLHELGIKFNGFIVSDERPKPGSFMSHPVYPLSEIDFANSKTGIILAMNTASTENVIPRLKSLGTKDFFEI